MDKKIVIITGANSGIGKAAAFKFASEQYHVIMACRNIEKSKAVQEEIKKATNNINIDLLLLDVSSFQSIREFCKQFEATYPRLDILIHNAAYLNYGEKQYQISKDGIELSFATNTIGPFLMTRLLLNHLRKSENPTILHACTTNIKNFFDPKRKIEFDNLCGEYMDQRRYSVYKMYGDSKMALLMLTFKLADELQQDGININALQINRVKISKETITKMKSPVWRIVARLQNLTNPLPTGMADHYFHICTSDEFKNTSGQLINHKRQIIQPSINEKGFAQIKNIFGSSTYPRYANDPHNVEKIWSFCLSLINKHSEP